MVRWSDENYFFKKDIIIFLLFESPFQKYNVHSHFKHKFNNKKMHLTIHSLPPSFLPMLFFSSGQHLPKISTVQNLVRDKMELMFLKGRRITDSQGSILLCSSSCRMRLMSPAVADCLLFRNLLFQFGCAYNMYTIWFLLYDEIEKRNSLISSDLPL